MPWWWKKKKADKSSLSITPLYEERIASKVDLGALAPPLADYLATACSLQHALASKLSTLSGGAWGSEDADDLGLAVRTLDRLGIGRSSGHLRNDIAEILGQTALFLFHLFQHIQYDIQR